MRHAREGTSLTVSGLVRNQGAAAAARITAVVFAFDKAGRSSRAAARRSTSPRSSGDESPFVVTIPNVETWADTG